MSDLSTIRALGLGLALLCFLIAVFRLRRHSPSRLDVAFLLFTSLVLAAVSSFPELASLPAEMLHLRHKTSGRLITLLLVAVGLMWFVLIGERTRGQARDHQLDRLFRAHVLAQSFAQGRPDCPAGAILVVIPALDEAESLEVVLPRLPATVKDSPVRALVVDDGSTDGTPDVARKHGALVVEHPFNRGGGAALRTGYELARQLEVQVVVTMDADGQHQPEEIAALVTPILDGDADAVIGSRVLGECENYSLIRLVGVRIFNLLIRVLTGTPITDCSSGFRAFRLSELAKVRLVQDQFHTAELIIDAAKKGMRIVERPIKITRRHAGHSKKGANLTYAFSFLRTILATFAR